MVVLLSGSLFAISAYDSQGTDLRPGRYTDLATLVSSEAGQYDNLKGELDALAAEVDTLTGDVDDTTVDRIQEEIDAVKQPAGLTAVTGPGISVTLSDAPEDVINATEEDVSLLVVHQQDIQAVVNAMWRGGAEAVTIQGQRIVSTTGIKCHGPVVQLQGIPYPQPYVIEAIGDPTRLATAVETDEDVALYVEQAADPEISVGWDLGLEERVDAPAYDGLLGHSYARPLA